MKMKPNNNALPILEDMISWSKELGIDLKEKDEATLLNCSKGGYDAGALFAEICLGGLATVGFTEKEINGIELPSVQVHTDHPGIACLDCQKAEWVIEDSIASGPARSLNENENRILNNSIEEEYAILALEASEEPSEEAIDEISKQCEVENKNVFILYAPTDSLVGSIQISARVIETAIHKLERHNYEINKIKHGFGTAPIAPVSESPQEALGKTNDAIIYGGTVTLHVQDYSEKFEDLVAKNSSSYGKKMKTVFEEVNYNFHKIDEEFFAPAEVTVNSLKTGKIKKFGEINTEMLKKSFRMEE